jgi:tryptophan halogenase
MADGRIRDIVIVGGGTAGWMAAAALAKVIGTRTHNITLVESDEIGIVGVGEATIPPITLFNKLLGIDEDEFVRETHATFKLGIEFVDWQRPGHRYMHHFGLFGADMNGISFSNHWLRWVKQGGDPDNARFSAEAQAALQGRFGRTRPAPGVPRINYAFQFDAASYAAYLRAFAERSGVVRVEGRIGGVRQHPDNGFIAAVELGDGRQIEGDLFIDCSGFRGLLIEGALAAGYDDWSRWLPANRAVAVPCERIEDPTPYTRSTARNAGWQWRIPLQHRTGNGYVFSDAFISEDEAAEDLLANLDGAPLADPRMLRFTAGRRRRSWIGNCVALGLSSGFLEPLESTSIHLIQAGISKLLTWFPDPDFDQRLIDRYNQEMEALIESVRDFVIAHYKVTDRDDTAFWRHCRAMDVPDSLKAKLEAFRRRGEVMVANHELFREVNWFAILYGQGLVPESYHPVADAMPPDELAANLARIRAAIESRVAELPSHRQYLERAGGAK